MKDKIKLLFKDIDFNKKGVGLKIKSIINEYLDVKEYLNNELKIYPMYDSYFYIIRTCIITFFIRKRNFITFWIKQWH